jgi:LPXTG-motif cell wall-anchored protein
MHNITVTVVTARAASQTTYFSINIDDENENVSTTNNPIPTIPVVAGSIGGIAVVGFGLLFYFKKRRRLRSA